MNQEQTIPIRALRNIHTALPAAAFPAELRVEPPAPGADLPQLRERLAFPAPAAVHLLLRVHNGAGIPIIEAQCCVPAGHDEIIFAELRPLGIEAYEHAGPERRAEVARRVWARRQYATLAQLREQRA